MAETEDDKPVWFHEGYPELQSAKRIYPLFRRHIRDIAAPALQKSDIRVCNLNPDSALDCFPRRPFSDVPALPIICAYYTEGTGYAREAENLRASIERIGYPHHHIEGVPSRGNWQRNTQFKAEFIRSMIQRFPLRPILYVDADATLETWPSLFNAPPAGSVMAHIRKSREMLSGTVYFATGDEALRLVDHWVRLNEKYPTRLDQCNLQSAVDDMMGHTSFACLPADYCAIFDLMPEAKNPVIKHWQASRRLKAEVNAA